MWQVSIGCGTLVRFLVVLWLNGRHLSLEERPMNAMLTCGNTCMDNMTFSYWTTHLDRPSICNLFVLHDCLGSRPQYFVESHNDPLPTFIWAAHLAFCFPTSYLAVSALRVCHLCIHKGPPQINCPF